MNDPKTYDRSYSLHEVLEHGNHPEEIHAYAAKIAPNVVDKDELNNYLMYDKLQNMATNKDAREAYIYIIK